MEILRKHVNNKTVTVVALILCVLIALVTAVRLRTFSGDAITVDLSVILGKMEDVSDNSRYVGDAEESYVLCGNYTALGRGYYTVECDYTTDENAALVLYSRSSSAYLLSDEIVLNSRGTHASFDIRLTDRIDDLQLWIGYSDSTQPTISSITITENTNGITTRAFIAIVFVLFIAACFSLRKRIEENKSVIFWLALITVTACAPAMAKGMPTGHDGEFHLLRIEGLVEGLRQGYFPVRMQTRWMEGYGYPVSIFYGDLLLYIPALLRLVGFTLEGAYKAYLFLINLGTALAAYACFKQIAKDKKIALIGTASYVFAAYRITNLYVRVAVGEYSAMFFLPLIALAIYRIYTEDEKQLGQYLKSSVLLAVGMTGLLQTHMISVIMACIAIAITCVILIKKTLRKNTLIAYVAAVAMTALLNLFFIMPFLDYMVNESVSVYGPKTMQEQGAYFAQYFALYSNVTGASYSSMSDRMVETPGLVLIAAFIAGIYFCIKRKDRLIQILTLLSGLMLWLASAAFPWNFIMNHVPLMSLLSRIQYPWRFLSVAQLLLAMLLCALLAKTKGKARKQIEPCVCLLLVVMTAQMFGGVLQGYEYVERYNGESIDSFFVGGGEYLKAGTDADALDGEVHLNNAELIGGYTRNGKYATITGVAASESDDAWVELPILNYKNYVARDGSGNELTIVDGDNNVIRVLLPSGYVGDVTVIYEIPTIYKIADVISLLTAIGLAAWVILDKTKLKEKKQCIKRFQRT